MGGARLIESVWGLLVVGAILASAAMALMWVVQVRIRDTSHVDVAWAVLIACCAILYGLLADGDTGHRVLAAALASIWGFRLGAYLLFDRVLGKEEDGRYRELRRRWSPHANRRFFWFFQSRRSSSSSSRCRSRSSRRTRRAASARSSGPVSPCGRSETPGRSSPTIQLARWRGNPENTGKTARAGLWSWSRHPNYFFESVTWCGIALVASAAPWGWLAWLVPAGLLYLLFKVTGIPATEAQALRSREDYAEYQRTTSVFVPLPPRG